MSSVALAYALCAAVLFALGLVCTAIGLRHRSARRGAAVSVPTAALLFILISPYAIDPSGFSWHAVAIFAAVGLGYPGLVTLLTFEAARRAGPSIAGAISNLTPLFAISFAILVLGEIPHVSQIAGVAVVLTGVMLISVPSQRSPGTVLGWAILFPLAGALLRGGLQPTVKLGFAYWPDAFAAVLVGYIVSAVVLMSTAGLGGEPPARSPRRSGILWFMLVGLGNGFAVLSLYTALGHAPVALVAPVVAIYPLFTLAFSVIILRGTPHPSKRQVAGIIATVAGIALLLSG